MNYLTVQTRRFLTIIDLIGIRTFIYKLQGDKISKLMNI